MIASLISLPPHMRKRLESALKTGLLSHSSPLAAVRTILGLRDEGEEIAEALTELERLGISGKAAAVWLRALDVATARSTPPDLVWSGPEVPGLHARDTRRVYGELIGGAVRSLWISTFVYFDGPRIFADLARRMESVPALRVKLLLNIQRGRGDTTREDSLVRRFASDFWGTDWPGSTKPAVFYDPRSLEPDGPAGVLHAKAVVADGEVVFVTSANLTDAALNRNIELGILLRDRALATSVSSHFQGLIDEELLLPLPTA